MSWNNWVETRRDRINRLVTLDGAWMFALAGRIADKIDVAVKVHFIPADTRRAVPHSAQKVARLPGSQEFQRDREGVLPHGHSTKTATHFSESRLGEWFDTCMSFASASLTLGNVSRTLTNMRSDGISECDFTIFKHTELKESATLQFRAEFFNLSKRVQSGFPGRILGPAYFGVFNGQINDPRLT